jgi:hypothetical protein
MILRKYSEADFPLSRVDRKGTALEAGNLVRICEVPDVAFHAFDALDAKRYAGLLGRVLPICEFDEAGYAVIELFYASQDDLIGQSSEPLGGVSFHVHHFCFDARDIERAYDPSASRSTPL